VPFSDQIAPFANGSSSLEETFDYDKHTWRLLLSPNHTFRVQIDSADALTTTISPITTVAVSQSSRSIIIGGLTVPFVDDTAMFRWYIALQIHVGPRGKSQSEQLKAELQKRLAAYQPPNWPEPEQDPGIRPELGATSMILTTAAMPQRREPPRKTIGLKEMGQLIAARFGTT
jgi:hypothetical protein